MPSLRPGIHHLAVCVNDLDRAEAFYVGLLGLPDRQRWTDDEGAPRSLWLELGEGAFLAVEKVTGGPARSDEAPGHHCVAPDRALGARGVGGPPHRRRSPNRATERLHALRPRTRGGALIGLSHFPDPVD